MPHLCCKHGEHANVGAHINDSCTWHEGHAMLHVAAFAVLLIIQELHLCRSGRMPVSSRI
jgi:hypothetical protein